MRVLLRRGSRMHARMPMHPPVDAMPGPDVAAGAVNSDQDTWSPQCMPVIPTPRIRPAQYATRCTRRKVLPHLSTSGPGIASTSGQRRTLHIARWQVEYYHSLCFGSWISRLRFQLFWIRAHSFSLRDRQVGAGPSLTLCFLRRRSIQMRWFR